MRVQDLEFMGLGVSTELMASPQYIAHVRP